MVGEVVKSSWVLDVFGRESKQNLLINYIWWERKRRANDALRCIVWKDGVVNCSLQGQKRRLKNRVESEKSGFIRNTLGFWYIGYIRAEITSGQWDVWIWIQRSWEWMYLHTCRHVYVCIDKCVYIYVDTCIHIYLLMAFKCTALDGVNCGVSTAEERYEA